MARWVGCLLLVGWMSGCGDPEPPPDGDCPSGCDDGTFCNGAERCVEGECVDGAPPCPGVLLCSESMGRCESPGCDFPDADGDGVESALCGGSDCDDADPERFPGALEVCDAIDQDCDPSTLGETDADGDGAISSACCNGSVCGSDCDDSDPAIAPGEAESCNSADDDCDGAVDEGVQRQFFIDADGDGFGELGSEVVLRCFREPGFSVDDRDCDDTLPAVNPSALEQCDGLDNDCNGVIDDADVTQLTCTASFGSPPHTFFGCAEDGTCEIADCAEGWADCNREPSDGCEVDTRSSVAHCGACDRSCGVEGVCTDGGCDGVVDFGIGPGFGCARRGTADEPGPVVCWGDNAFGQLGDGTTLPRRLPVATGLRALAVDASVGRGATGFSPECPFTCAFDGELVFCWGCNRGGQMGNRMTYERQLTPSVVRGIPIPIDDSTDPVEGIVTGGGHACVRKLGGRSTNGAVCWGAGLSFGQTSGVDSDPRSLPFTPSAGPVERVFTGWQHTCVLASDDSAYCTGRNHLGQLGDPGFTASQSNGYRTVAGGHSFVSMGLGFQSTCGVRTDGTLRCWGRNDRGQLGRGGAPSSTRVPGVVEGLDSVEEVAVGLLHACARTDDGRVHCWGANDQGELGDGTNTDRTRPVEVMGIDDAIKIDVGRETSCALRADGDVWCWGSNADGVLGDVPEAMRNVPGPVPGL